MLISFDCYDMFVSCPLRSKMGHSLANSWDLQSSGGSNFTVFSPPPQALHRFDRGEDVDAWVDEG